MTSPEWSFALETLRAAIHDSPETVSRSRYSHAAVDWDRVPEIALAHRIGPLLYRGLRRLPGTSVPPRALAALKEQYLANAARNALLFRALRKILGGLDVAGISAVVLKGAWLADRIYPDRALRPMNDIDLLVRSEDLDQTEAALLEIGYRIAQDPGARREARNRHHHWIFRERTDGIPVEVHWNLHPPDSQFCINVDGVWRRTLPIRLAGASARALAPEDHLVYLMSHAARHRFHQGVLPLCDIAAILASSRGSFDAVNLVARAKESRCGAAASALLDLAAEMLGARAPEDLRAGLRAERDEALDPALVRARILDEKTPLRAAADLHLELAPAHRIDA
jgi:hypothetical protein